VGAGDLEKSPRAQHPDVAQSLNNLAGLYLAQLERNYRSIRPILAAANAVISFAKERFTKNLRSDRTPPSFRGRFRMLSLSVLARLY
jgi:hypothetical protein